MRVVLTSERYAPQIGGAELVVQRVAEGLAAQGHDVTVVSSGARASEHLGGVTVERWPAGGNLARGLRGDVEGALRLIEEREPDVVLNYAAQTWTTDACARWLDRPRPFALVLAPCGFSALRDPAYAAYFERMRDWLPRYDALIFHSRIYQDWAFAERAGAANMHVIPNGADPPVTTRRLRELVAPRRLVVTVGSHVHSKGHADFARVVGRLGREQPLVGAIVAPPRTGADAVRGCYLRCAARAAASRSLRLVDGRERAAALDAIASADVFLLPSQIECAPVVILEAMAAGVPWVSYDAGNVRELAGGVVVHGPDALVEEARRLLGGSALGSSGRAEWASSHRWPRIVERYDALLTGVIAGRAARA